MPGPVRIVRYNVASTLWSLPHLRIAVLADLHACGRWMPLDQIKRIVAQANATDPDVIVLPGDFLVGHLVGKKPIAADEIAGVLSDLKAPQGVYASLGNHDWADCPWAQQNGYARSSVEIAFADVGIRVLKNAAVKMPNGGYVVGLDSAIGHGTTFRPKPRHDLSTAFATVPKDASTILLAHEPDVFLEHASPAALQISGHTHGGQIGALGILATRPSRYGMRLDYGHKQRKERNLIISGGLGYGGVPLRLGRTSEISLIHLRAKLDVATVADRQVTPLREGV